MPKKKKNIINKILFAKNNGNSVLIVDAIGKKYTKAFFRGLYSPFNYV